MLKDQQDNISNIQALMGSIETDPQVCRWFIHLLSHPQVHEALRATDVSRLEEYYFKLKTTSRLKALATCSIIFTGAMILLNTYYMALIGMPLLIACQWMAAHWQKKAVVHLSRPLIQKDFPPATLPKHSLFQIAEHYAQTYKIASMVDIFPALAELQRIFAILLGITFLIILPLSLLQAAGWGLLMYYCGHSLLNNTWIYQQISSPAKAA